MPVEGLAIGEDLKGVFATGDEGAVDGVLWFALGTEIGVELAEMEAGISVIGVIYTNDGISVWRTLFVGDVEGSLISMRLTVCPVSVYVALATKPQFVSTKS